MMKTLAIDASTKCSGYAIFENTKLINYGCISDNKIDTFKRIRKMRQQIKKICQQYKPTDIIMEQVLPQNVKGNQNVYKALIYLQAAIVLCLDQIGYKVNFYTASHWRAQCGIHVGRGVKRDLLKSASIQLVKDKYNITVNDDVSDAILLGMAYVNENGSAF